MVLARRGDSQAFEMLVTQTRPRALSVALKVLRNADDAEDAVQDAFMKVWRYLGRFEGRSSVTTWIHRIVMNTCLDLLRRQNCRPDGHVDSEEDSSTRQIPEPVHDWTPERSLRQAQTGAIVHAAIATLSPQHRQAITLREIEERSYEEIANASRCPVGTVMSRLHHARRRLAEALNVTLDEGPTLRAA